MVVEDLGERALEFPGGEEERPIDHVAQLGDRRLHDARAGERRRRDVLRAPGDRGASFGRDPQRQERRALPLLVLCAELRLQLAVLGVEDGSAPLVEQ